MNVENIENETSVYRYKRMEELLSENPVISPENAAVILRDYKGLQGKDIGLGNEKAVNQFIAHHSVIFQPEQRRIWVAGPPYQLGEYWAVDMDSVFGGLGNHGIGGNHCRDAKFCVSTATSIPADTLQISMIYPALQKYRRLAHRIEQGQYSEGDADSLVKYNPDFFHTYRILGDYFKAKGEGQRAEGYYREALEKEAPSATERAIVIKSATESEGVKYE